MILFERCKTQKTWRNESHMWCGHKFLVAPSIQCSVLGEKVKNCFKASFSVVFHNNDAADFCGPPKKCKISACYVCKKLELASQSGLNSFFFLMFFLG